MHTLKLMVLAAVALVLGACGGGSDDTLVGGSGTGPGGQPPVPVGSVMLLTSSPQIPSDGTANATITALVRDSNNNVMQDVPVILGASSGSLVVTQPAVTDANGVVTATLSTAGNPTNRTITVTGTAGNAATGGTSQSTVTVNVIGTTLTVNGPASLPIGASGTYNVVLTNAGNAGISGQQVTVTSANGNGVSASPITTDVQGRASFNLTASNGGNDTLTVSALGMQATQLVAVSSDQFTFSAPNAGTEVALGSNAVVTVTWLQNGAPVQNMPVNFSTTRGTLSAGTVNTDASGNATITVAANNAGPALLTATNNAGTSIQRNIEFVATTPASLELQANPFTVATNDQSTLTAIVRDAQGNLVKNQVIAFALNDVSGGSLSVAQATTDSQGRAQTFYTASSATSAVNGVTITATVQSAPAVTDSVSLTVAQRQVFISIGTGNEISEVNFGTQYEKHWVVQVTDAQGNGVDLVDVTFSVHSIRYWDGHRFWDGDFWASDALPPIFPADMVAGYSPGCPDEDIDFDGVLDPGEDQNNNQKIEAGNIATAFALGGGNLIRTDTNGFGIIVLRYPQEYAYWLEVVLEVRTIVQGTEFSEETTFILPGSTADFNTEDNSPPGITSPFGSDGNCATPPPL